MNSPPMESTDDQPHTANCDQEVWVKNQVLLAMKMAIEMYKATSLRCHEYPLNYGLLGVSEGAAVEIIETLCLTPDFVNLRKPPKDKVQPPTRCPCQPL